MRHRFVRGQKDAALAMAEHEDRKRAEAAATAQNLKTLYSDFVSGRTPANNVLTESIGRVEAALRQECDHDKGRLSARGKQVAQDVCQLLETTNRILTEKNQDNKLQSFLWSSGNAVKELSAQTQDSGAGGESALSEVAQEARDDLHQTLSHGRSVALLLAKSPSFRRCLTTLVDVARLLLGTPDARRSLTQAIKVSTAGALAAAEQVISEGSSEDVSQHSQPGLLESAGGLGAHLESQIDESTRESLQLAVFGVLEELSADKDHRKAAESLFRLISLLTAAVWQTGSVRYRSMKSALNVDRALKDGKMVIEEFIGAGRLDPLLTHARALALLIQADNRASQLLDRVQSFFVSAVREPASLRHSGTQKKARALFDDACFVAQRYKAHPDVVYVLEELRSISDTLRSDPALSDFGRTFQQLMADASLVNAAGKRTLDPFITSQLKSLAIPLLIEQLHYIPLSPQSATGPVYDWSVENIVLSSYDILPEHIFVDTLSHTDVKLLSDTQHAQVDQTLAGARNRVPANAPKLHKWGLRRRGFTWPPKESAAPAATTLADTSDQRRDVGPVRTDEGHLRTTGELVIRAYNIHLNLKNVKFSFIRKKWPRLRDQGLVDISSKGKSGCCVVIRLDLTSDAAPAQLITGGRVKVRVPPLSIKFHDNRHFILLPTLGAIFSRAIRNRIEEMLAERMNQLMLSTTNALNAQLSRTPDLMLKVVQAIRNSIASARKGATSFASAASSVVKARAQ